MICGKEGIEADTIFAMKALMKERPFLLLTINFLISSTIFAFAVRCAERPYYDTWTASSSENKGMLSYQDFSFITNAWWLIVVTMTTVGFGDYFAKTYIGRIVSIIATFYGVFLVSLMVVTMQDAAKYKVN
jgi:hypothetical protein